MGSQVPGGDGAPPSTVSQKDILTWTAPLAARRARPPTQCELSADFVLLRKMTTPAGLLWAAAAHSEQACCSQQNKANR